MSDYGSVNSKPANTNYDPNSAFADAVQRARQKSQKKQCSDFCELPKIAAKIHTGSGGGSSDSNSLGVGTKRSLEETFGAQLAAMQQQRKVKELIGQIVNRGGQAASSEGQPYAPEGQTVVEMMIPGGKVGLVIGKGGETIRNLQERAGVKMVMIQDGPQQTVGEKPLRITGEAQKCEFAKQMVLDLITEKELEGAGRGRGRGRGFQAQDNRQDYGGSAGPGAGRGRGAGGTGTGEATGQEVQYSVPANKCGLVIGKGGETIRSINQQTGAHVELSRAPPPTPHEKIFIIRGNPQQIEHAQQLISERIGAVGPPAQNGPPPYPTQYPQPYGYNQQPPPPAQPYAPQGWGNAYQHWQNQTAAPNDPSMYKMFTKFYILLKSTGQKE
ncbi:far upstream element-binding protein 2-like isoform X2 [Centruroides sculpturatus]|uniref:far upstream element-binding protein 2-like isoform X2 n=1 Tax=Centruroides sculpturatus TaxID=218467 RepID=UPI000C6E899A|nr:far upstream element-binding protein 2-like isoform X2 [Centruroides sculpturatus]